MSDPNIVWVEQQRCLRLRGRIGLTVVRINLKRAIVLLATGQAETLELSSTQQWEVRSPSVVLQIPDYIRLTSGNPEQVPLANRREVFRRAKPVSTAAAPSI